MLLRSFIQEETVHARAEEQLSQSSARLVLHEQPKRLPAVRTVAEPRSNDVWICAMTRSSLCVSIVRPRFAKMRLVFGPAASTIFLATKIIPSAVEACHNRSRRSRATTPRPSSSWTLLRARSTNAFMTASASAAAPVASSATFRPTVDLTRLVRHSSAESRFPSRRPHATMFEVASINTPAARYAAIVFAAK